MERWIEKDEIISCLWHFPEDRSSFQTRAGMHAGRAGVSGTVTAQADPSPERKQNQQQARHQQTLFQSRLPIRFHYTVGQLYCQLLKFPGEMGLRPFWRGLTIFKEVTPQKRPPFPGRVSARLVSGLRSGQQANL